MERVGSVWHTYEGSVFSGPALKVPVMWVTVLVGVRFLVLLPRRNANIGKETREGWACWWTGRNRVLEVRDRL